MMPSAHQEATFVAGDPAHEGWIAVWPTPEQLADDTLDLVVRAGSQVRNRQVPVRRWPLRDALPALVDLPADTDVRPSVQAWSAAARIAVELVARGRLTPSAGPDDRDQWVLGPLDPGDLRRRDRLAESLPAAAHCHRVDGSPLRIAGPEPQLVAFGDAVADLLPRTASAARTVGHDAYASPLAPTALPTAVAERLRASAPSDDAPTTVLRIVAPPDDTADREEAAFRAVVEVQSRTDPSLILPAADLWDASSTVLERLPNADDEVLLALRRGARAWPPLHRLLDEVRPDLLVLADPELDELLGPASDELAGAGIEVRWPADLISPVRLRPVLATPTPAAVRPGELTLDAVAELSYRASVDGTELTDDELAALAGAKRSVVRLRGRWVRADAADLARATERRRLGAGDALALALGGPEMAGLDADDLLAGEEDENGSLAAGTGTEIEIEGPLADLVDRLRDLDRPRTAAAPDGLDAALRPYQERGLAWLCELADLGLGGVLADDMGLGKTIQFLATVLHGADGRPSLVVCPASVIANWEREAARFGPDLPVRRYHGASRTLDDLRPGELVVATYGVVRRDAGLLADVDWRLVAADEAQAVKNPLSRTAKAMRQIRSTARFALTGTPVENRLTDLWALLDWTTPGLLGPLERFQREVSVPIERHQDPDVTAMLGHVVRPFLLRRRKIDPDIAPELPAKTEIDRIVPLTVEQASLYAAATEDILEQVEAADGIHRRGLVLKLLTALKQICNHPAHYLGQDEPLAGRSGKLDAATDLLEIVRDEGDHSLVFTQYVAMAHLLDGHLTEAGHRTGMIHGSMGVAARERTVDGFQAGELDTLVISLKAGGTGINLTRATHVVHYDRWWNPAVEDQASDRAWRIGQDRPVQVHRLVTEGTVEEKIARLLTDKRSLADAVVGSGEGWISDLSDDELAVLVGLGGTDEGVGAEGWGAAP